MEPFKYLGILFMSEGRTQQEIDAVFAVTCVLYPSTVVKRGLGHKDKATSQHMFLPSMNLSVLMLP